ncbi:MAG: alkaline phosphatase family protein [Anaeroplasmataceae bacterium]|nr:alkaline phosphatase family protein [Anaeroplasmataceae bacterium]
MEKVVIKEKYEYWYFEQQQDFFKAIENLLQQGYQITDSLHLCVELSKDDYQYLLSYIPVSPVDENIKETLSSMDETYKLVYPNYSQCILNTIASIRNHFGGRAEYSLDPYMEEIFKEKNYKNVIVLLLDGLGENILEQNVEADSFLKKNHLYTNTAIYPSTTAAATTATLCGLSPIRTGWLGWANYFKEIKRNIVLFTGKDYFTDEATGFSGFKALPTKPFFHDLNVNGTIHQPNFAKRKKQFKKVVRHSLKSIKRKKKNVQYVYYTQPDSLMHTNGAYHDEVCKRLKEIDDILVWYSKKLPKDTLLIISADHGHTNVEPIDLYQCEILLKMLNHNPANDSRCITFSVKDEYRSIFPTIFEALFGYAYDIMPSSEAIRKEFFGKEEDIPCSRAYDFLADYVAVAKNKYYFNYKGSNGELFKSHHAGITADEMLVPVIVFRK